MFRRRKKLALWSRVGSLFWPRSGWVRSARYLFHRTIRLPGTPYSLAAGFACGAAISFTPFVGFHFILSAVWAWLIRASIIGSAVGTVVGNPWTFPFIWMWIYNVGNWMGAGGADGVASPPEQLDFGAFFGSILDAFVTFDPDYLIDAAAPVWWPMLIGSLPTLIVVWIAFYIPLRSLVCAYHRRSERYRRFENKYGDANREGLKKEVEGKEVK